jgi:uncharacterized membrane protein
MTPDGDGGRRGTGRSGGEGRRTGRVGSTDRADRTEPADGVGSGDATEDDGPPEMADLYEELQELAETVDSPAEREQVEETIRLAMEVNSPGVFGKVIRGFDRADAAEALLGALLFGIPMFVEGGTQEVGTFIATNPLYLLVTHLFTLGLVVGILYVADIQDVRIVHRILGVVPRRLVGVLGIALVTAVLMMTVWGRVDWADPWLAFCQVTVAYVPMSIGAALGDILPGT